LLALAATMLASDATAGTEPISAAARTEIKAVALAAQGHHEEADKLFHAAADADLALSHRNVPTRWSGSRPGSRSPPCWSRADKAI